MLTMICQRICATRSKLQTRMAWILVSTLQVRLYQFITGLHLHQLTSKRETFIILLLSWDKNFNDFLITCNCWFE